MRMFWLIVYYGFARHLPKSIVPGVGKFAGWLRWQCARHMFAECNGYVNLEQNAYIGDGKNFHFVGHGCIGKDFVCHNRVVTVHGGLIMGENVLFQGGAYLRRPECAYWHRGKSSGYTTRNMRRCMDRS